MNLLIDAGNSRIKWRIAEGLEVVSEGVYTPAGTPASPLFPWDHQLVFRRLLVSSVLSPAATARLAEVLAACPAASVEWLHSAAQRGGVVSGYKPPDSLGTDRFAALIGARHWTTEAAAVVMVGTAVTVDCLDGEGVFRGGLIVPGLRVMQTALSANTGQLGMEEGDVTLFPGRSADALASGRVFAVCGALEKAVAAWTQQFGALQVLLSGGDQDLVRRHLAVPASCSVRQVPNLVLDGLMVLAAQDPSPA